MYRNYLNLKIFIFIILATFVRGNQIEINSPPIVLWHGMGIQFFSMYIIYMLFFINTLFNVIPIYHMPTPKLSVN